MTVVVEGNLNKRFRSIDGSDDHCDNLDNEILRIAMNHVVRER